MQILINILFTAFLFCILSVSFSFVYYPTRYFHIAHAAIITFAAYFTYFFFQQLNFSFVFSVSIAIVLSVLLGMLTELIIYRPLRKKKSSPLLMLIASLGLYVVLQNCISILWSDNTKNIRRGEIKVGNEIFGAYITDFQITTIVVSISLFIFSILFLKYNKIGRNIRAVSANSELANIQGINSDKIILWSFGIGSGLAAIAGILVASDTGMTPTMGFNLLLYGVVAMIIGGVGSTWSIIGGAFLLATAQHLTSYYIDSKWMDAVTYVILILFLIWKPLGFSGKHLKKTEI
jgi:branched-chain amino acid transport system permease protein